MGQPTGHEDQRLRCLLVQQPYASLMAFGRKCWEFRSYETKRRGRIGIAASPSSALATKSSALNAASHSFPRGVLLATADLVNCFYVTSADIRKAIAEPVMVSIHGHEILTVGFPIGEPEEDVREAINSNGWESYVWELADIKPLPNPIAVGKRSRSTWVLADVGER